ncbi:MAG: DUF1206 domain-containing protein [Polyangiales bacterium]
MALTDRAQDDAERVLDSRGGDRLARIGEATRGMLWGVVGGMATKLAVGGGGKAVGTTEAMGEIARGGRPLLVATAIGLVAYAGWRIAQAIADEAGGRGWKRWANRIAYVGVAISHLGLALIAAQIALGSRDEHDRTADVTAKLLHAPAGRALVFVYAAIAIGTAVTQLVSAVRAPFRRDFQGMTAPLAKWATALGRFGQAARAVVFGMMGLFLLRAAWHVDPQEAKGLGASLFALRAEPSGWIVFTVVAIGLLSYAAFCLVHAPFVSARES